MTRTRASVVPYDKEVESALLGAALITRSAAQLVAEFTTTADFHVPAHRHLRDAIATLVEAGHPVDPVTVAADLARRNGQVSPAVTRRFVYETQAGCPAAANAETYLRTVHDLSRRRQWQVLAQELARAAAEGGVVDGIIASLEGLQVQQRADDSEWRPLDLEALLAGEAVDAEPVILTRDDGACLLYAGKLHFLAGEPESGKSWLALVACAEQIGCGRHAVYIDFEDSGLAVAGRLVALGVEPAALIERFAYMRPGVPLQRPDWTAVCETLVRRQPAVVVIDGLTEALTVHNYDLNSNRDIAAFMERLPRPIARQGPAVVVIDHVAKARESRGRWPIGAQHKLAGLDGASYSLEVISQVRRGAEGFVKLWVEKDRPGHVRDGSAGGKLAAEVRTRSEGDEFVVTLAAPLSVEGPFRPTSLMESVSRWLELNPGSSRKAVRESVRGKAQYVLTALDVLIAEGFVAVEKGSRQALLCRVVKPYRNEEP